MKIARPDVPAALLPVRLTRRRMLALLGASGATALATDARSQAPLSCVVRPRQTEGPFFVDEPLDRSDIRSDPRTGQTRPGVPLRLAFRVSRLAEAKCAPLAGARVDVWHCDAQGVYSDVRGFGFGSATTGTRFLRGYQLTDAYGVAQFLTIYPGWYGGRAVHVHFKIRSSGAGGEMRDFTSQLYFDEHLTEHVYAREPYAQRRQRWLRNADDALYRDGGRALTLAPEPEGDGYAAGFDVALVA